MSSVDVVEFTGSEKSLCELLPRIFPVPPIFLGGLQKLAGVLNFRFAGLPPEEQTIQFFDLHCILVLIGAQTCEHRAGVVPHEVAVNEEKPLEGDISIASLID